MLGVSATPFAIFCSIFCMFVLHVSLQICFRASELTFRTLPEVSLGMHSSDVVWKISDVVCAHGTQLRLLQVFILEVVPHLDLGGKLLGTVGTLHRLLVTEDVFPIFLELC